VRLVCLKVGHLYHRFQDVGGGVCGPRRRTGLLERLEKPPSADMRLTACEVMSRDLWSVFTLDEGIELGSPRLAAAGPLGGEFERERDLYCSH
jgi:hypothetical protein